MILRRGMHSTDVAGLQRIIGALGFDLDADGWFGPGTENVVRWFQRTNGLVVDGIAGPKTLAMIDTLYEPGRHNFTSSGVVFDPEDVEPTKEVPKRLEGCHFLLVAKALKMIDLAEEEGYDIRVTQGLRSFAYQQKLFEQRPRVTRAAAGFSWHNYGTAADFAFWVDGDLTWDGRLYPNLGRWAGRVGLESGVNWRFRDMPHVQLNDLPSTYKALAVYNNAGGGDKGIQAVWKEFV